jgi:L-2-amino-thiazoline-4-carboxylic acid hydrolase-like protein
MDEIRKEREEGLDWEHLGKAIAEKNELEGKYYTSHISMLAQLFGTMAKVVMEKLGEDEGTPILEEAVKAFGKKRGKNIAEKVTELGLPLSFKNFLVYTDLDTANSHDMVPKIEDGKLIVEISRCDFSDAAKKWGVEKYAAYYCRHIDVAILEGYNPDLKIEVPENITSGGKMCILKYTVKK